MLFSRFGPQYTIVWWLASPLGTRRGTMTRRTRHPALRHSESVPMRENIQNCQRAAEPASLIAEARDCGSLVAVGFAPPRPRCGAFQPALLYRFRCLGRDRSECDRSWQFADKKGDRWRENSFVWFVTAEVLCRSSLRIHRGDGGRRGDLSGKGRGCSVAASATRRSRGRGRRLFRDRETYRPARTTPRCFHLSCALRPLWMLER